MDYLNIGIPLLLRETLNIKVQKNIETSLHYSLLISQHTLNLNPINVVSF